MDSQGMTSMCCPAPATSIGGHGLCLQELPASRAKALLRLTDDIGLVLEFFLHVPPALEVLFAVPPVGLLADLLPALLVDALRVSDGGSAVNQKQNFQFPCRQLSRLALSRQGFAQPCLSQTCCSRTSRFRLCLTQTPISALWFCPVDASPRGQP